MKSSAQQNVSVPVTNAIRALAEAKADTDKLVALTLAKADPKELKATKTSIESHYATFIKMLFAIGELEYLEDSSDISVTPEQLLAFNVFDNVWKDAHQVTVFNNQEDKCEFMLMPTHPTDELLEEDYFFASEEDKEKFKLPSDKNEARKLIEWKKRNQYFPASSHHSQVYVLSGHGADKKLFYINKAKKVCNEIKLEQNTLDHVQESKKSLAKHEPVVLNPEQLKTMLMFTEESICQFVSVSAEGSKNLNPSNASSFSHLLTGCKTGYILVGEGKAAKLYYINLNRNECTQIQCDQGIAEKLLVSDLTGKMLEQKNFDLISDLTGHYHVSNPFVRNTERMAASENYSQSRRETLNVGLDRLRGILKETKSEAKKGALAEDKKANSNANEVKKLVEFTSQESMLARGLKNVLGNHYYEKLAGVEIEDKDIGKKENRVRQTTPADGSMVYQALLAVRSGLRSIKNGIRYITGIKPIKKYETPVVPSKLKLEQIQQQLPTSDVAFELDEAAYKAIVEYKNKREKIIDAIGVALGAFTSFIFGVIEAGPAIAIVLPTSWPILAVYAVTIPLCALAFWVNYEVFIESIPRELKKYIGKDKFLDGVTDYRNPKTGLPEKLSFRRKAFIAVFTVFSLLTGVAIGALGSTGIMLLQDLPWLGALIKASPIALAILSSPAIMIVTTILVSVTMALMLNDSITKMLQENKKLGGVFEQPFKAVAQALEKNKASWLTRVITYLATVALSLLGLIGLVMACYTSSRSIGLFLIDKMHVAPLIADKVGTFIAMGPALISRFWWTLRNMLQASVVIFKGLFSGEKQDKIKELLAQDKPKAIEQGGITNWLKEKFAPVAEAFEEAFFYFVALAKAGKDTLAVISFTALATGVRTMGTNIRTLTAPEPDHVVSEARERGIAKRREAINIPKSLAQSVDPHDEKKIKPDPKKEEFIKQMSKKWDGDKLTFAKEAKVTFMKGSYESKEEKKQYESPLEMASRFFARHRGAADLRAVTEKNAVRPAESKRSLDN